MLMRIKPKSYTSLCPALKPIDRDEAVDQNWRSGESDVGLSEYANVAGTSLSPEGNITTATDVPEIV